MGFTDVYDYVNGKVEWMVNRNPVEGTGPHYAMVGEVATMERLYTCDLESSARDSVRAMEERGATFCLVVNSAGIVLGRLRKKHGDADPSATVREVMESGPSTVRPSEAAKELLERMDKHGIAAMTVTTDKGVLVGIAHRKDLGQLVAESE